MTLTPIEEQIADLMRSEKTQEQIAAMLNVSRRTVQIHIENMKIKLEVKTLFKLGEAVALLRKENPAA
jgi:DNA-binding CsgD family transcriptional regulator